MHNVWPFLLKVSLAFYFIYPNITKILDSAISFKKGDIFSCVDSYIPAIIAHNIWHGAFVALGVLILLWPRPILPLSIAAAVLAISLYVNFGLNSFGVSSILLITLILVALALIIYYAFHKRHRD